MSNKKLIQQYVNTGTILPEYQVNKLPSNNLKSYLRRRLQQSNQSTDYELKGYELLKLPEKEKNERISNIPTHKVWQYIITGDTPKEIIKIFGKKGEEFIKTMDNKNLAYILFLSESPYKLLVNMMELIDVNINGVLTEVNNLIDNIRDSRGYDKLDNLSKLLNHMVGNTTQLAMAFRTGIGMDYDKSVNLFGIEITNKYWLE